MKLPLSKSTRTCACLVLSAGILLGRVAVAQQAGNVVLDSNEQIFCVLAALNAAGYDNGIGVDTGNDTREQVRRVLAKKKIAVLPELQRFYESHRVESDPGATVGQYVSLALFLGPPPGFRFTVPKDDLPPDAKWVAGLVPLLERFYLESNLLDLWASAQSRTRAEVERYSDPVRRTISLADAYFRFPGGTYLGRTYTIDLDLLAAPEQTQSRIYGFNYFLVVTPSKNLHLGEIRHQYLHFLLDPLAAKYAAEIEQKAALKSVALQAPALATDFKEDFPLLVTECLIRAAELRMDKKPNARKILDEMTASGLILTQYFFDALAAYEEQEGSMSAVYKAMILKIDPRAESKKLATVKFSQPPAPEKTEAPAVSEEARLLDQADGLIYRGRYNEAKTAYQTVLERFNRTSERALYGLAVVASNTRKPDLAEEYFQKTLEIARDSRITTWSHIYLGRLYDMKGKRQEALAQYRAASLTAASYPEALLAVRSGLEHPFGSKD